MKSLTADQIREVLDYNPDTGEFVWKSRPVEMFPDRRSFSIWNTRYAGKASGCINNYGYLIIKVHGALRLSHRLAWILHHGSVDGIEIDHINHIRTDNRLCNLRAADTLTNRRNQSRHPANTSGVPGVFWLKESKNWRAIIGVDRKTEYLGVSDSFFEAVCMRKSAEAKYGFHPNHGMPI